MVSSDLSASIIVVALLIAWLSSLILFAPSCLEIEHVSLGNMQIASISESCK